MKNTIATSVRSLRHLAATVAIAAAISLSVASIQAQVSLTGSPNPYTENFNNYRGSSATLPAGFTVGPGTLQGAGTGTNNTGGYYAFAATGNTSDYSFGVLRSSSGTFTLNASFTNNTGSPLTNLTLGLNYEQYRYANTSGFTVSGSGVLSGNYAALTYAGTAAGTIGTPTTTPASLTLTGLSIANGATFGFVFTATDPTGADNGIAIDDFSLVYSSVPEPGTIAAGLLALGTLGWSQRRRLRFGRKTSLVLAAA